MDYLREIKKEFKTVLACVLGTQRELFKEKKGSQKSRDTVPISSLSVSLRPTLLL